MVGAYFEPVTEDCSVAQLIANRAPGVRDWRQLMQLMLDMIHRGQSVDDLNAYGTVVAGHWASCFDEPKPLPRAREPQRVMGRPRKAAPKPGRKFSGMTRFSWRQR